MSLAAIEERRARARYGVAGLAVLPERRGPARSRAGSSRRSIS